NNCREWDQPLHHELRPAVSIHGKMDIRDIPNTEAAVVLPNEVKLFILFFLFCFHCVFLLRLQWEPYVEKKSSHEEVKTTVIIGSYVFLC
ncbi:hypothetical protein MKX03_005740, partial [Papaver bracteatum]